MYVLSRTSKLQRASMHTYLLVCDNSPVRRETVATVIARCTSCAVNLVTDSNRSSADLSKQNRGSPVSPISMVSYNHARHRVTHQSRSASTTDVFRRWFEKVTSSLKISGEALIAVVMGVAGVDMMSKFGEQSPQPSISHLYQRALDSNHTC